jgi:Co/Zn/Cd efflux system component
VCFLLLHRHRGDDLNMRSTWLCSRNDLIANTSVIGAAVLVSVTGSLWPDVAVGVAIAALFLHTAWYVLISAWEQWRAHGPTHTEAPRQDSASARPGTSNNCQHNDSESTSTVSGNHA